MISLLFVESNQVVNSLNESLLAGTKAGSNVLYIP